MGYVSIDDDIHAFAGNYFATLAGGTTLISEKAMEIKMLSMDPADRAKQELILKNQRALKEKMKQEAAYKKQLEDLSQAERKVKQAEKNTDSRANKLKFGMDLVKFEPPAEQRGGGWGWARIDLLTQKAWLSR